MYNHEDIQDGDKVVISSGRLRDKSGHVCRVTPKQFKVLGHGTFWKKNGIRVGDSDGWIRTYARPVEAGDEARIKAEQARADNLGLIRHANWKAMTDEQLARIGAVIREADKEERG